MTRTDSLGNEVNRRESQGGIGFDLIIENPTCDPPASKVTSPTRPLSIEEIESKLKAAEERRLQLEKEKLAAIKEKIEKSVEPPPQKISVEDIEAKLKAAEDRRLALEAQRVLHLKEKDHKVHVDHQPKISVDDIESKLKAAEERRKSMEAQKLLQLKEHEAKIAEVRMKRESIKSEGGDANEN